MLMPPLFADIFTFSPARHFMIILMLLHTLLHLRPATTPLRMPLLMRVALMPLCLREIFHIDADAR